MTTTPPYRWWSKRRLTCLFTGHARRPLSLPGGSRLVFAGPCARCDR